MSHVSQTLTGQPTAPSGPSLPATAIQVLQVPITLPNMSIPP